MAEEKKSTALTVAHQRMVEVKGQLQQNREALLRLVGGDEANAERLITSALIAVADSPDLAACEARSVCRAVLHAAMAGADLTAGRGDGWIVPFKGKATFLDGYALWRRKMAEAGYQIVAEIVCAGDTFRYRRAPLLLEHDFDPFGDRGKERGAYAAAYRVERGDRWLVDAEVIGLDTIDKAREGAKKRNRDRESPAWAEWWEQMAVRLPIKRLAKRLDLRSSEHAWRLLELERMQEGGAGYHPLLDKPADIQPAPAEDLAPGRKAYGWSARTVEPTVEMAPAPPAGRDEATGVEHPGEWGEDEPWARG